MRRRERRGRNRRGRSSNKRVSALWSISVRGLRGKNFSSYSYYSPLPPTTHIPRYDPFYYTHRIRKRTAKIPPRGAAEEGSRGETKGPTRRAATTNQRRKGTFRNAGEEGLGEEGYHGIISRAAGRETGGEASKTTILGRRNVWKPSSRIRFSMPSS